MECSHHKFGSTCKYGTDVPRICDSSDWYVLTFCPFFPHIWISQPIQTYFMKHSALSTYITLFWALIQYSIHFPYSPCHVKDFRHDLNLVSPYSKIWYQLLIIFQCSALHDPATPLLCLRQLTNKYIVSVPSTLTETKRTAFIWPSVTCFITSTIFTVYNVSRLSSHPRSNYAPSAVTGTQSSLHVLPFSAVHSDVPLSFLKLSYVFHFE